MSKNDRKILINDFEEIQNNIKSLKNMEWENIKKKSLKDILFQNYLIHMKETYELRDVQIKKLYNLINLGLMLKSIKNSDIIYEEGKIKDIKGIVFTKGKYKIELDIYSGLDDEITKSIEKKEEKLLRNL